MNPQQHQFDTLQVVWPKSWVADEFKEAGVNSVIQHTGIEVVEQSGPIWWATEHAAKSMKAGHKTWLVAPNYTDFYRIGHNFLHRGVRPRPLGVLYHDPAETAFVKPADCKIVGPGDCGKAMVANTATWAEQCLDFGVFQQTVVLVQDPVEWVEEWRFWYDGLIVVEGSLYQRDGATWDEWEPEEPHWKMAAFAMELGHIVDMPCVIDVGILKNGKMALVEFNPVWSSGPYTSDYWQIFRALRANYEYAVSGRGRKWIPEAWLLR